MNTPCYRVQFRFDIVTVCIPCSFMYLDFALPQAYFDVLLQVLLKVNHYINRDICLFLLPGPYSDSVGVSAHPNRVDCHTGHGRTQSASGPNFGYAVATQLLHSYKSPPVTTHALHLYH